MANKDYDAKFWQNEYEQLRRKKNKEILEEKKKLLRFMDITWQMLKELNVSDNVIFAYYKERNKYE